MTNTDRLVRLLARKALLPHADAPKHADLERQIRAALRIMDGDQCADTDGLAAERDPLRVSGEVEW